MTTEEITTLRTEFVESVNRLNDKFDKFADRLAAIATTQATQRLANEHTAGQVTINAADLHEQLQSLDGRLELLEQAYIEAKGARRAMMLMGAMISGFAGVLGALTPHLLTLIRAS